MAKSRGRCWIEKTHTNLKAKASYDQILNGRLIEWDCWKVVIRCCGLLDILVYTIIQACAVCSKRIRTCSKRAVLRQLVGTDFSIPDFPISGGVVFVFCITDVIPL